MRQGYTDETYPATDGRLRRQNSADADKAEKKRTQRLGY